MKTRTTARSTGRSTARTTARTTAWIPRAALLGTALALLAGCDTAPKVTAPVAAAPVETRRPLATPVAATPPAATATATPQSSVATIDLARNAAPTSVAGAAATGSKPTTTAAPAATAAVASTAMMAMPSQRVVYFDFDSYAIKDDFKATIDAYARALQANRGKKLVVEGHTDERGGREYNLALGQKRAAAVVSSLTLLGATEAQLEAVSFGEERPASQGNDEAAWSKNRRAELKDR